MANLFNTEAGRNKVLKRFSMFDGVGNDLRQVESYDEALWGAGIDYTAEKKAMYLSDGTMIKNNYCVCKSDDGAQLGVVGKDYKCVSNREAFSIAEEIVNNGKANYETGGACRGAKNSMDYAKTFMVLRGDDFDIMGDTYNSFYVFNNSFDGSTGVKLSHICQRLVCLNGLTRFLGGKKNQLRINIQHSSSALKKIEIARQTILEHENEIEAIRKQAEAFEATAFSKREFEKEIIPLVLKQMKLTSDTEKERQRGEERIETTIAKLIQAYNADDVQNFSGAYRTILALSDFETHAEPLRNTGNASVYLNRATQGFLLTGAVAEYIASTRGIRVNY